MNTFKDTLKNIIKGIRPIRCSKCASPLGNDNGPPEGWQLEDGRTVCHACCLQSTKSFIWKIKNPPNHQSKIINP